MYRLAPCTKYKKFIFRDFVFSKNGCNFEPEFYADKMTTKAVRKAKDNKNHFVLHILKLKNFY